VALVVLRARFVLGGGYLRARLAEADMQAETHSAGLGFATSLQGSAHQLVQLLCHHCTAVSSRLRCTKRAGHKQPRAIDSVAIERAIKLS
jgi:hypothetical protein